MACDHLHFKLTKSLHIPLHRRSIGGGNSMGVSTGVCMGFAEDYKGVEWGEDGGRMGGRWG